MREFNISLPATSANLGPAFDAAALALDLFLRVKAKKAKKFSIISAGRDSATCSRVDGHLILETYKHVLADARKAASPLALAIRNEFPIGKGFGSSAAARLAGIALAVHFGGLRWNTNRIIAEAARREHHPDNAAACWMGDRNMLACSLDDRMHQPYRAELCPLLPALQRLPEKDGVLGVALSGAGPSVLMFLDPQARAEKTKTKVESRLRALGIKAELISAGIAKRGGEASFLRRAR